MEDEDGEGRVVDTLGILEDQEIKESMLESSLNHTNDDTFSDQIEEDKFIIPFNSIEGKDSPDKNTGASPKIVFKGFKKRILAQAQESQTSNNAAQEQLPSHVNISPKNNKEKRIEGKRGKITEYAQYLGLQPASKHKCSKCHSATSVCSTLKQAQCTCNSTMAPMQGLPSTSESSAISLASNFKISRKVYLCAACGTYFENWNLFLHMRDIHKRHICLFCLGMFGQAERLSYHLAKKHSVPEMDFTSVEEFYGTFKGSCYLVCCTCEKVFSETDNFYNHFCSPPPKDETTASTCTLCRQTGSHASTCSLAIETNSPALPTSPHGPTQVFVSEKPAVVAGRGAAKKTVRNNRAKHVDDSSGIPNRSKFSAQLKRTNSKGAELHAGENEAPTDASLEDRLVKEEILSSPLKDTVSETIMEVSKYLGDSSSDENESRTFGSEKSSVEIIDSVTQTIMEVSRVSPDLQEEKNADEIKSESKTPDRTPMEYESPFAHEFVLNVHPKAEVQPDDANDERKEENEKTENAQESITDLVLQRSASPPMSPVNHSLFSPQHEAPASDILFKEERPASEENKNLASEENKDPASEENKDPASEDNKDPASEDNKDSASEENKDPASEENKDSASEENKDPASEENKHSASEENKDPESEENKNPEPTQPTESQTSISSSKVITSDRSLVIKICANKNSQFSVTAVSAAAAATNGDDLDTRNVSRESEENNNGEDSEDKLSNASEGDRCSVGSDQINESDSDVDKLAMVEGNTDEPETAEDTQKPDAETASDLRAEGGEAEAGTGERPTNQEQTGIICMGSNGELAEPENNEQRDEVQEEAKASDGIVLAGEDVPSIDLNVESTLESTEIESLLKGCIEAASPSCVYCNHARHIAVNGKQLGLHMLAEHKFQPQHPAIIIHAEQFVSRVRKSLDELEDRYFNLSSYSSVNGTYDFHNVKTYECFHCRFHSAVHKELYLHNRKMHQKTILICIMCKSTFYSYSELLCHLCPGVYSPNINVKYRCCFCPVDGLPSAFRLMVHLRKRHHACDVCLESTGNQQRLSNHVWKHKLHHLCYRCGIAYRNKPDITKHLFWKHGTESVLCKKCLQKKWPHIYHFCIPPTAFVCEECGSSFSRAVALKVHKRLHSGDQPYGCQECSERFISKKLLLRHEKSHREPSPTPTEHVDVEHTVVDDEKLDKDKALSVEGVAESADAAKEPKEQPVKKVVDVYDLPPLNLSSESDTDSEDERKDDEKNKKPENDDKTVPGEANVVETLPAEPAKQPSPPPIHESIVDVERDEETKKQEERIMDGIWDNFKTYAASLEMQESSTNPPQEKEIETDVSYLRSIVLVDHDYCVVWSDKDKKEDEEGAKEDVEANDKARRSLSPGSKTQNADEDSPKKKAKSPKKKKQGGSTSSSDSSSDSDSSSCSCGTNCSCSSSSSGSSSSSSSSSDSDSSASESSPRKQSSRKDRKKDKDASQETKPETAESQNVEVTAQVENGDILAPPAVAEPPKKLAPRESDLETDETDTDEDFYDEHPQQLANKILAEKRNQLLLLAAVAPASTESNVSMNNGAIDTDSMPTPSPDPVASNVSEQPLQQQQKKKVKTKKRKRGEKNKQRVATPTVESLKLNIPKAYYQANSGFAASSPSMMALQTSRSSTPILQASESRLTSVKSSVVGSGSENDNKRSSKRKRIPKRFYGDSSDEEAETASRQPAPKWRKVETYARAASPKRTMSPKFSFAGRNVAYRQEALPQPPNPAVASATESEDPADSSSDSSDTEVEASGQQQADLPVAAQTNVPPQERTANLYCYCQCPYDEVSEMIACDGEDCRIEWFHFECVGIMIPPKGKWYCPDCRKKHGMPLNSEDYFD